MLKIENMINKLVEEIRIYEDSISEYRKDIAVKVDEIVCNFDQFNELEKHHSNVNEFLDVTFEWKKSQRNDYKKVGRFLRANDNAKKYIAYNFTQLVEIAGIKAKDLSDMMEKISPDMSAKEIREVKKTATNKTNNVAKKKATKADVKAALAEMLACDDVDTIKAKIRNLMADL